MLFLNVMKTGNIGYGFTLLFAFASNISPAVSSIAIFGAILVAVYRLYQKQFFINVEHFSVIKIFLIGLLMLSFTCIFSVNPGESAMKLLGDAARFLPLFMSLFFIHTREQICKVAIAMMISVFIADIFAFSQLLQGKLVTGFDHNRIYFANQLQHMATLGIVMYFLPEIKGKKRWLVGAITIFTVTLLIFNQTRGVWIAFGIMLLVLAYASRHNKPFILPAISAIFFVGLICLLFFPELHERLDSITDLGKRSNFDRLLMFKSAWLMFCDHPIWGVGIGQFGHFYTSGSPYLLPDARPNYAHPHNIFFTYLAETGIVGFISVVTLIFSAIYTLWRKYILGYDEWTLLSLLTLMSFIICGLTDNTMAMMNVVRIVALMIGLGLSSQGQDSQKIPL